MSPFGTQTGPWIRAVHWRAPAFTEPKRLPLAPPHPHPSQSRRSDLKTEQSIATTTTLSADSGSSGGGMEQPASPKTPN